MLTLRPCPRHAHRAQPQKPVDSQNATSADPNATSLLRPKRALESLAVLQQLGVKAQAGIHQKHMVVDQPHLHRHRRTGQQCSCGLRSIDGNAVSPRKVIESALRQHPQGTALGVGGLGHGADGAVTADGNHRTAPAQRRRCAWLRRGRKLVGVGEPQFARPPAALQRFDDTADRCGRVFAPLRH